MIALDIKFKNSQNENNVTRLERLEKEEQDVTVKDFNMPFSSMVIFMVKWAIASIPAIIIIWILVMILISVFGSSLAVLRII